MPNITSLRIGNNILNLSLYAMKTDIKYPILRNENEQISKRLDLSVYESSDTSVTLISKPLDKDSIIHVALRSPNAANNTFFQISQRHVDNSHLRALEHISLSQYTRAIVSTNIALQKGLVLGLVVPIPSGSSVSDLKINPSNPSGFFVQAVIYDEV